MPMLIRNQDSSSPVSRQVVQQLEPAPGHERSDESEHQHGIGSEPARLGLFASCANPGCRSNWMKLWRSRSAPVFEGGWCCSAACMSVQVEAAVRREMEALGSAQENHRHRIPLGLAMLEQGWISQAQLRGALDAQRAAGGGRLGQWLVRQQGVSEHLVTRALGLQWSCP
ncbi:MAG: hypothetical protein ACRD5L_01175, partial [Bryobacteraceae bacterium]